MKFVLVAHYLPPLNSTGARRVLAFAKYLHRDGHEVVFVTSRKSALDGPLTEALPPYVKVLQLPAATSRSDAPGEVKQSEEVSIAHRLVRRIRRWLVLLTGQLLDPRLAFSWRTRALDSSTAELAGAEVVISSAPPWPVHIAGSRLARRLGVPWIADYRDQFSRSHLITGTALSRAIEAAIDRKFARTANAVVTVSPPMRDYYARWNSLVEVIPNGFDPDFFTGEQPPAQDADGARVIRYLGRSSERYLPVALLRALDSLTADERSRIRVEFVGEGSEHIEAAASTYPHAASVIKCLGMVPHAEALQLMRTADALLVTQTWDSRGTASEGVVTTKLLEYLGAGRPILGELDPHTEAARILTRSGLAIACSRDATVLAEALRGLATTVQRMTPDRDYIATFSRQQQTRDLVALVARLTNA